MKRARELLRKARAAADESLECMGEGSKVEEGQPRGGAAVAAGAAEAEAAVSAEAAAESAAEAAVESAAESAVESAAESVESASGSGVEPPIKEEALSSQLASASAELARWRQRAEELELLKDTIVVRVDGATAAEGAVQGHGGAAARTAAAASSVAAAAAAAAATAGIAALEHLARWDAVAVSRWGGPSGHRGGHREGIGEGHRGGPIGEGH